MEVVVSNVQLLGVLDAIRAKLDALVDAVAGAHPEIMNGSNAKVAGADAHAEKAPKRTRKKSAYNKHMSEELARLKISHPDIGHRQRFSMAVATWKAALAEASASGGEAGDKSNQDASEGLAEPEEGGDTTGGTSDGKQSE